MMSRLSLVSLLLLLPLLLWGPGLIGGGSALAQTFALEGNQLKLDSPVVFEGRGDKLRPESDQALSLVKAYLEAKQYITLLRIEDHGEGAGDGQASQRLSERRALSVARVLVSRGVDCKRLLAVGFGDTKPLADASTADGRAKNRRTVFVNAALRGRPIGGMPLDGGGRVAGDCCK